MKMMLILSLLLTTSTAFSADFPVGTFTCKTVDKVQTVKISEFKAVGGKSVPYVEISGYLVENPTAQTVARKAIADIISHSDFGIRLVFASGELRFNNGVLSGIDVNSAQDYCRAE